MQKDLRILDYQESRQLRLNTLIRLRWLAIVGQSAAIIIVDYWFDFATPLGLCFALIACSAWINLFLAFRFPATHRLQPPAALAILVVDAMQMAGLLFLTGGLTNPFAILMVVPVVISATALPLQFTAVLALLVTVAVSILATHHFPLPWFDDAGLAIPFLYVAGIWMAVVSTMAFTAVYVWRVAEEARQLAAALTATELVLQREQHLSALDGLAAAAAHELGTPLATIALVAKEMQRAIGDDPKLKDDLVLLRSQSERCKEILKRLTSLSSQSEEHFARLPLTSLIEDVIAPHRDFGIEIRLQPGQAAGPEPVGQRNPGVIYGLGNLVENAVDFARDKVSVRWSWDAERVTIGVTDDGPGFPPEIIDRIGEPYMTTRSSGQSSSGGLGLGLFIAKTLLERSGADVSFRNAGAPGQGAEVVVTWPREVFLRQGAVLEAAG